MKFLVPHQLESGRLLLRQFQDADWPQLHRYFSDAQAMVFTQGRALSEGETWRVMCSMIGHWQIRGYGPYAVTDKTNGTVMGTVGFWYPNDWPEPEIKWGLASSYWGKGYATEAARLVLAAGYEHLPELALISLIHEDNKASIGLALAVGATRERSTQYEGEPHGIYRHKTASQAEQG
jgi:RimJ/RimL family protein N-acetyltransferase